MTEYAPAAIQGLFDQIAAAIPSAVLGGIIGDQAHDYGYHRGRDYVSSGDYSTQLDEDQLGSGQAACGLDLSWTDAQSHYDVSQRLLDAAGDPRMYAAREFYGSTDGWTVCGWDYAGGYPVTSDDSHLWHVHLSILRQYADDPAALDGIAAVITGTEGDDEMSADDSARLRRIEDAVNRLLNPYQRGAQEAAGVVIDANEINVPQYLNETRNIALSLQNPIQFAATGQGQDPNNVNVPAMLTEIAAALDLPDPD